ncbi:hypothetical protein CathTA2_1285 [Caldalkalibacillus thermarum TA2.A1]|uniref:DUF2953 domain-containing protein n=1 Tax=Caldalkalibacillus thermarum (strain TA2.A1) TaxID=986075 RepID=F5L672_CALTT|nr:DUF2953 domain-containing protein [Caldalkalibacillus thermarum]EGL83172.1 hypothetical protein CathTA2_1285 [Caldalkalibacillus thermarum TA2.A1]QZT35099.1 DUF2953 domain-containing protein [Caldalkalibacillus thermarum TA2.A1]
MIYVLAALLAQCGFMLIIWFTPLHISIHYIRQGQDDLLRTQVRAWFGLINLKNEFQIVKLANDLSGMVFQAEMESQDQSLDQKNFKMTPGEMFQLHQRTYGLMRRIHGFHHIIKSFLNRIRLVKLEWYSRIGTGFADETGLLTGMVWTVKSTLVGLLSSYLTLRTVPRMQVKPSFQEKVLETEFKCMIRFQFGHAILAGIRILLNLGKRRDVTWKNTPFKV